MVEHAVPEADVDADGFTVEQWLAFDGAGDLRVELIDGALVVSPAPVPRHQQVVHRIMAAIATPLGRAGLTPEVSGGGVVLPGMEPGQGLIPDILAVPLDLEIEELTVLEAHDVVLAIEVLSASSRRRDRVDKLRIYAEMGIAHFWVVDPRPPVTITVLALGHGTYQQRASASGDESLSVAEPFEVTLTPSALTSSRRE